MNIIPTLIILGVITAVTGIAECFLAREDWRLGLILPILSVIAAFFFRSRNADSGCSFGLHPGRRCGGRKAKGIKS